jgi:hypothetical protein
LEWLAEARTLACAIVGGEDHRVIALDKRLQTHLNETTSATSLAASPEQAERVSPIRRLLQVFSL